MNPAGEHLFWHHHATDVDASNNAYTFVVGTLTIHSFHYFCTSEWDYIYCPFCCGVAPACHFKCKTCDKCEIAPRRFYHLSYPFIAWYDMGIGVSITGLATSKYYMSLNTIGTQYFGRTLMVDEVNTDVYFSFVS